MAKIKIDKKALEKEMFKQTKEIKKQLLPQLRRKIEHLSDVVLVDLDIDRSGAMEFRFEGPEDQILEAQKILTQ